VCSLGIDQPAAAAVVDETFCRNNSTAHLSELISQMLLLLL
jgi:hypothetical protein